MMHHMKLADCDPKFALYHKFIATKMTVDNDQSHAYTSKTFQLF